MNKRISVIIFTSLYFCGLTAVLFEHTIMFACFLFFLLILLTFLKVINEKIAVIFFSIFAFGIFNCSIRLHDGDIFAAISPQNDVTVQGRIVSLPSSSDESYTKFILKVQKFKLSDSDFQNTNLKTMVTFIAPKSTYKNLEIGDTVSMKGHIVKAKHSSNPSEFCYGTFLKHKNIFSCFYVSKDDYNLIAKPQTQPYKFLSSLNRLRNKIIELHSVNIHSPELELLGGIVFGDDAVNPTPEMKNDFQKSGLTHIIAASGMNVSVIFGMWFFISQILKLNYGFSIITGMLFVICYTCMTGFGPPVLRAALMLLLILFGKLIDRKADSIALLFIVAFIMLVFSPTMIMNIGFQLSFIVTFGLMIFCPLIFDKIKNKYLNIISSFVVVPVIAQIFAAPLQMYYFNSFSPYSVFANIAVVPILSVVSFGGFTSCVLALIKPISRFSVSLFDFILQPLLHSITSIAYFFSNLPKSTVTVVSPTLTQLILYYVFVLTLYVFLTNKENKLRYAIVSCSVFAVLAICFFIPLHSKYTEILFFSVENADCALIKTKNNKFILIDTGKAPYKNFSTAAERVVLKYFEDKNIKNIDMIILSHYDSDHAGGATYIMDKVNINKLLVRNKNYDVPLAAKILKKAEELKINVFVPQNNEISFKDGDFSIESYYVENGDDNETSIINVIKSGNYSALFTGDGSASALEKLKDKLPQNVDVLKSPHHGAKNTLSATLLSYINPKITVISTGFNIYGHPSEETLNLLRNNSSSKILRTDRDNAVKVVFHKNKILLYSYNGHRKRFEKR